MNNMTRNHYQHIEVQPLTPHIGAEISGIDLTQTISSEVMAELRQAFAENCVIFFRDQDISIEEHLQFGRYWGELFTHPAAAPVEGHKEIVRIKTDEHTKQVAGEIWHTDTSCEEIPPMGSILHMIQIPPIGGDTLFAPLMMLYQKI